MFNNVVVSNLHILFGFESRNTKQWVVDPCLYFLDNSQPRDLFHFIFNGCSNVSACGMTFVLSKISHSYVSDFSRGM